MVIALLSAPWRAVFLRFALALISRLESSQEGWARAQGGGGGEGGEGLDSFEKGGRRRIPFRRRLTINTVLTIKHLTINTQIRRGRAARALILPAVLPVPRRLPPKQTTRLNPPNNPPNFTPKINNQILPPNQPTKRHTHTHKQNVTPRSHDQMSPPPPNPPR